MERKKYPNTMFVVQIHMTEMRKGIETFCIGLDDVHNFVEEQKNLIGKENYSGYNTQAVNLSEYASEVIKRGVEIINVES